MIESKKIKDVSSFVGSGTTPLRSNKKYWENGVIRWLKTEQLGEKNIYDTTEKITKLALQETSIKIYPVNTLSVALYGEGKTRGNVSILKNEMTTNQACCNIVLDKQKANYEYVYYYLKTQYNRLRGLSSGVRKNLNSNDIKEFEIRLPQKISDQQKIAAVLSALDAKIELNARLNAELESMAKTLYDYWFVQFAPHKSAGGEMVWNDELKREIPLGWKVGSLGDFVDIFDSKRIPLSNAQRAKIQGQYPYYGATGIMDYVNDYIFDGEYLLIAEDGSVMGDDGLAIVQYIWGKTWVNNHAHVLQPKDLSNKDYLYFLLKSISVVQIMTGSIQKKITQDNLLGVKFALPDNQTLKLFSEFAIPTRHRIINIYEESQRLRSLRDWLLPMLMNGQINIET